MTEQEQQSSAARQILKILYAPHKAFKEIIKEPKYAGPVLILILFTAANVGYGYAILSRSYIEQTVPKGGQLDSWNENATKWISSPGASVTENFEDFINGSYYGNRSIAFSVLNSSQVFMELTGIGPLDCSESNGYKNVSVRVKVANPQASPSNASLYLFSQNTSSEYFYYNMTNALSSGSNTVWNNLTIPLGTAPQQWAAVSDANWTDITGLKLEFSWPGNSNITVLVDGLYFRGIFKSPLDTAAAGYLFEYGIIGLMQFAIQWIFISGLIFVMAKALGTKTVWRPILIAVGFALAILFVQNVINAIAISTLPNLYYRLEYIGGTQAEIDSGASMLYNQTWLVSVVMGYVRVAVFVWIIALCAAATRLLVGFSWMKSALVATAAVVVTTLISILIGV